MSAYVEFSEALDDLDRRASLLLATGGDFSVTPLEVKKLVKAARGLDAAKAAYSYEAERIRLREVSMASGLWRTLAYTAVASAILKVAGLT